MTAPEKRRLLDAIMLDRQWPACMRPIVSECIDAMERENFVADLDLEGRPARLTRKGECV